MEYWECFICKRKFAEKEKYVEFERRGKVLEGTISFRMCLDCFHSLDTHGIVLDINKRGRSILKKNVEVAKVYPKKYQSQVNLRKGMRDAKYVVVIRLK